MYRARRHAKVAWCRVRGQRPGVVITLDTGLAYRAVLNLAGNAADACLAKGPGNQVTLEVTDSDDKQWVEFRVMDTGIGISFEHLEVLEGGDFNSTKRSTGVGLGLGVVRQVATSHQGELIMESNVGLGSTFTLRLPRGLVSQ
jgi:signal transduction histidine kinase